MVLVSITNNMSIMMKSLHIEEAGSSKNACDQYCKHKEKYPQRKFKYGGINAKSASVSWSLGHFRAFA